MVTHTGGDVNTQRGQWRHTGGNDDTHIQEGGNDDTHTHTQEGVMITHTHTQEGGDDHTHTQHKRGG